MQAQLQALQHHFRDPAGGPQVANPYLGPFGGFGHFNQQPQQQPFQHVNPGPNLGPGLLGAPPAAPPPLENSRAALLAAARRLQEEESSSSDEEQGTAPLADFMNRRYEELRSPAADSYFTRQRPTSNVLGAEYLAPAFSTSSWLDQELAKWEAQMSSQDRKRQIRTLKSVQFLHDDLRRTLARAPGMMPLSDVLGLVARNGQDVVAAEWGAHLQSIKDALDAVSNELEREAGYVFLANDKGNKHGFGTIDRMRDFARMEELVPKATMDLYNKAHTSMNSLKSVKRSTQKSKKQKKKGPNAGGKPKLNRSE